MDETMAPRDERSTTRRTVLTAAAAGVGGWLAAAIGRASPVAAADGDVVNVGESLTGANTTVFTVPTESYSALWGKSTATQGAGVGIRGDSGSTGAGSAGVWGNGGSAGVRGTGGVGVRGEGSHGVLGVGSQMGVYGYSDGGTAVRGNSVSGVALSGESTNAAGVEGMSHAHVGVVGFQINNGTAVVGISGTKPIAATPRPKTGVYGQALQDSGSRGVWGASNAGQGVRGDATSGGGVSGNASNAAGYAFRGSGRVRFDKVSGVATIPAGATSVTVTPGVDVTADTFALLTAKANLGSRSLYYSTDATNNRFTIRMSSSRPSSTPVAWLLLR